MPFRRPLSAIVAAPETAVGALGSEALAVGAQGEVARYKTGLGWEPEFLLSGGKRQTPNLRGVAWPEPGRAFAVGDAGAMWVWQKATNLWTPDPAEPTDLIRANFTGIAFDPGKPSRGYAVGKQGVLLGYGRTWTQEALPAGVPAEADFTSIAFAGETAYATWKYPFVKAAGEAPNRYYGGVIVNEGSGWRVEAAAREALEVGAVLPEAPQRVAGLPDGGAAIAGIAGKVIIREAAGASWQVAAGGKIGYPVALAAIREGGRVRTMVSVTAAGAGVTADLTTDAEQLLDQPAEGQPPLFTEPYPLPAGGYLLRQTATGWRDEQHQVFPLPEHAEGRSAYDLPARPDPVLAILVNPESAEGWVVGGETGGQLAHRRRRNPDRRRLPLRRRGDRADQLRRRPDRRRRHRRIRDRRRRPVRRALRRPDRDRDRPRPQPALGGRHRGHHPRPARLPLQRAGGRRQRLQLRRTARRDAQPDRLRPRGARLRAAPRHRRGGVADLRRARRIRPRRERIADHLPGRLLDLPAAARRGAAPAPGSRRPRATAPAVGYYSFLSAGSGGSVRVVVLDYSRPSLGETQRCWLATSSRRRAARTPAIVLGDRDLARLAPNAAEDSAQVIPILVNGSFPAGCAAAARRPAPRPTSSTSRKRTGSTR